MESYHLDAHNTDSLASTIAERLSRGQVIVLPTDTVYGLVCRADCAEAVDRIYALKGRPEDKKCQLLIDDVTRLPDSVHRDATIDRVAATFWPGALTVILGSASGETVGVRVPDHPFILSVLRQLGQPLTATSANRAGASPEASAASQFADLHGRPDAIVYGQISGHVASTVVDLSSSPWRVLREGPITTSQLSAIIDQDPLDKSASHKASNR